jgi:hypothetical protein
VKSCAGLASLVLVLVSVASVPQASAIPFDAFTPLVTANASGTIHFQRNVPGVAAVVSSVSLLLDGDDYISTAVAGTTGFFGSPVVIGPLLLSSLGMAHVEGKVENLDRPTIHTTARASATFVYFIEVLGPPSSSVPLDIGWSLAGSGDGAGFGSAQILVSILTQLNPGGGIIQVNESVIDGALSGVSHVFVDLTDSLPDQLRIELRAQCGTSGLEALVATCSATVDPTFSIPSDFPDADLFRLEFSPNLAPVAVPQPGTAPLVMMTLLALAVRERVKAHLRCRRARRGMTMTAR